jgi:hypothetical protein
VASKARGLASQRRVDRSICHGVVDGLCNRLDDNAYMARMLGSMGSAW